MQTKKQRGGIGAESARHDSLKTRPSSTLRMFAVAAPGLEQILASEIHRIGLSGAVVTGGVEFNGGLAELYCANLWLRTASRVVVRVDEFHASSFHELERRARRISWSDYVEPGSRVRFRVTCKKSRLYHSDAVAERLARVIEEKVGAIDVSTISSNDVTEDGDQLSESDIAQLFVVRLTHDNCVISADSSGELLHRRGYRQAVGKAPLRETIAAAMVIGSGWDGESLFVDPMCGSGVIAIEAAMIARKMAPGIGRRFAFEGWPNNDEALWSELKASAKDNALKRTSGAILASDRDDGVVKQAAGNAERAGVAADLRLEAKPISALEPPVGGGWIVTNPPYGIRVGERRALRDLYSQFGKTVRARAGGYTIAFLSADPMLQASVKIELEEVFRTRNGGIPVRLVRGLV